MAHLGPRSGQSIISTPAEQNLLSFEPTSALEVRSAARLHTQRKSILVPNAPYTLSGSIKYVHRCPILSMFQLSRMLANILTLLQLSGSH
jgi:hypothetical protein